MKKITIILGLSVFLPISIALATTTPPTQTRMGEQLREERKEQMLDLKAKAEEKRVENKNIRTNPDLTPEQKREQIKENNEDFKGERSEIKNEIKDKREQYKEEVRKKNEERVNARLRQAVESLQKLWERIVDVNSRLETRIAKIKAEGINVDTVLAKLTSAKEKAELAKTKIETATTLTTTGVTSQETLTAVKDAFKGAQEAYRTAKEETSGVLKAIKELLLQNRVKKTASTTPKTN